ncbi:MAG: hypothetical protein LBM20_04075 [Rikenellaceae bacterium]|jgi:hypothetical protein|nr:hypothetical protein [Rikenellaceae bacterium]
MNPIIESLNNYAAANRWSIDGGTARNLAVGQLEFPVIWHQPLALTGKIGRNEGVLTYKLSFLLLDGEEGRDHGCREEIRERLEQHALGMIRTLENHARVQAVRLVSCRPAEATLTHYGETALTVTIEADVLYCHKNTPA